jgi:hypothetical protein
LGFDPLCDQSLFQARRKGSALQRHCRRKRGAPLIDKVALRFSRPDLAKRAFSSSKKAWKSDFYSSSLLVQWGRIEERGK